MRCYLLLCLTPSERAHIDLEPRCALCVCVRVSVRATLPVSLHLISLLWHFDLRQIDFARGTQRALNLFQTSMVLKWKSHYYSRCATIHTKCKLTLFQMRYLIRVQSFYEHLEISWLGAIALWGLISKIKFLISFRSEEDGPKVVN